MNDENFVVSRTLYISFTVGSYSDSYGLLHVGCYVWYESTTCIWARIDVYRPATDAIDWFCGTTTSRGAMEAFSHMMVTVAALATNPRALGK